MLFNGIYGAIKLSLWQELQTRVFVERKFKVISLLPFNNLLLPLSAFSIDFACSLVIKTLILWPDFEVEILLMLVLVSTA